MMASTAGALLPRIAAPKVADGSSARYPGAGHGFRPDGRSRCRTPPPAPSRRPARADLGLRRIANQAGLSISVLPNGCVFAIEHRHERGRTMINQVLGSPLDGGIGRLFLRLGGPEPMVAEAVGPGAKVDFGVGDDRFVWDGATGGVRHRVTLWLHPRHNLWLWRVEVANAGDAEP